MLTLGHGGVLLILTSVANQAEALHGRHNAVQAMKTATVMSRRAKVSCSLMFQRLLLSCDQRGRLRLGQTKDVADRKNFERRMVNNNMF